MKKLLLTSALLAALPLVVQASDITFRAGTYEASADGIHGPVVVKTTFSEHKIDSIRIVKQTETEGIGTVAASELPKKILNAQSGRTHQKLSNEPRYRSPFIGDLTRGTF